MTGGTGNYHYVWLLFGSLLRLREMEYKCWEMDMLES
jgi:hypothetical protein